MRVDKAKPKTAAKKIVKGDFSFALKERAAN